MSIPVSPVLLFLAQPAAARRRFRSDKGVFIVIIHLPCLSMTECNFFGDARVKVWGADLYHCVHWVLAERLFLYLAHPKPLGKNSGVCLSK
jgi:hypothetical protein